jgi:DNA mismatch repair ATPase MutS
MSGKSTMLRTVGTNLVLAQAGAPVRADSLTTSVFQIGTAMRIRDSLQTGESLFYAAVSRLKAVVEAAGGAPPLLFLCDEILQGTNSHDRLIGSEGVLRALVERGAMGLITTHDLALTKIADGLGSRAINVHFEDSLHEGKMTFDYRTRPGVVLKSNALELIRLMGLDV